MRVIPVLLILLGLAALARADRFYRVETMFQQTDARGQVTNVLVDGMDMGDTRRDALLAKFGGIGVVIEVHEDGARIAQVLPDTPGSRAGLQVEDVIVSVDDRPLKGYSLVECVMALRGVPGSRARLGVVRPGEPEALNIWIERDIIRAGPRDRDSAPQTPDSQE